MRPKPDQFSRYFNLFGVYDVLLGLSFLFFYEPIYRALEIALPNHPGYIFVPALLVFCGGIGEFLIARNPLRNVDLVLVRILMKLSFAGAVLYCHFSVGIPPLFLVIAALSVKSRLIDDLSYE
jgi:hypothetical protein